MPGDEYSAISGGGKLKLKGSKVKDGRVDKTKKKKKKLESEGPETRAKSTEAETEKEEGLERQPDTIDNKKLDDELSDSGEKRVVFKTEAERKHEEQRKKRVCILLNLPRRHKEKRINRLQLNDRLRREGVKTHKERVEELNRYLSTLSEHHDMYAIFPFPFGKGLTDMFNIGQKLDRDNTFYLVITPAFLVWLYF
jgi:protein FAM32A